MYKSDLNYIPKVLFGMVYNSSILSRLDFPLVLHLSRGRKQRSSAMSSHTGRCSLVFVQECVTELFQLDLNLFVAFYFHFLLLYIQ